MSIKHFWPSYIGFVALLLAGTIGFTIGVMFQQSACFIGIDQLKDSTNKAVLGRYGK